MQKMLHNLFTKHEKCSKCKKVGHAEEMVQYIKMPTLSDLDCGIDFWERYYHKQCDTEPLDKEWRKRNANSHSSRAR